MKKIFENKLIKNASVGAIFFGSMLATSCKKFTDLKPVDALSTSTSFSNVANIELAANGVYNTAAVGTYNGGGGRGYPFGGASIEQSEMRGEDMVNIAAFYAITYQNTYDATTANNVNMWVNLYQCINQANTFIDGINIAVSGGVLTPTAGNIYIGEARFLRALCHHELLIQFCRPYLENAGTSQGVPYRTIAVNSQSSATAAAALDRGLVKDDYTKILADLDFAEANLPAVRTGGLSSISRATSGAAIALKTRIKLHMGDWAGVISEGAKLGTSAAAAPFVSPIGGYKLTASPDGPFYSGATATYSNNTESIFSIAQSVVANGGVNGALPAMLGPADKGGRGLVCTNPNLYNAAFWVSSDTRRTLLQIQQATPSTAKYFFSYKFRDYTNNTDWAPVIRYAEVLLNVAEAYSRTGVLTNSLALLNAVRNRAVAVVDQYTALSFTTSLAMTQAILNERRIEFAGEGRRWADIHRLANDPNFAVAGGGIPAKVLIGQIAGAGTDYNIITRPQISTAVAPPANPALPYSNFRYVWPIPSTETSVNPVLAAQQNPGY
jgi:hypothetical protein